MIIKYILSQLNQLNYQFQNFYKNSDWKLYLILLIIVYLSLSLYCSSKEGFIGGGGSKKTTIKQKSETINEMYNKTVTNIMNEIASKSAQTGDVSQTISFSDLTAEGDIVLDDIGQKQSIQINFVAMTEAVTNNDISRQIIDQASANISQAATTQGGTGGILDFSKGNTNVNLSSLVKNISKNVMENNISNSSINECISNFASSQNIDVKNLTSKTGKIKITGVKQEQVIESISKCMNKTKTGSTIGEEIVRQIENTTNTTSSSQDADLGRSVGDAGRGLGEGWGNIYKGMGEGVKAATDNVDKLGTGISTALQGTGEGIGAAFSGTGEGLSTALQGAGEGISTGAKGIGDGITGILKGMIGPLIIIGIVAVIGLVIYMTLMKKE